MCRIKYSTERNPRKKIDLRNSILKYDVIHGALKVIRNENFKRPLYFGDIGSFANMGIGRIFSKNREIA
jgi:hypothetical protein